MKNKFLLAGTVLLATAGFIGFVSSEQEDIHPALRGCKQEGNIIYCELPPNSGFSVSQPENILEQTPKRMKP